MTWPIPSDPRDLREPWQRAVEDLPRRGRALYGGFGPGAITGAQARSLLRQAKRARAERERSAR